jgi:hypothetical protein
MLLRIVTVWMGLVPAQRIKSWLRGNVTGLFGVPSVFGRHIKGMIRLRPEQVWTCNVMLHVHTCSGCNRIIPLMRQPNTDGIPNKPVTLPRNQLLIRYVGTSPAHTLTKLCNVTSVDPPVNVLLQCIDKCYVFYSQVYK